MIVCMYNLLYQCHSLTSFCSKNDLCATRLISKMTNIMHFRYSNNHYVYTYMKLHITRLADFCSNSFVVQD